MVKKCRGAACPSHFFQAGHRVVEVRKCLRILLLVGLQWRHHNQNPVFVSCLALPPSVASLSLMLLSLLYAGMEATLPHPHPPMVQHCHQSSRALSGR